MAKANLGTKRVCPETERKFYDLEKDPIVSPYTGKEYAISFFEGEANVSSLKPEPAEEKADEAKTETTLDTDDDLELDDAGPEIISLEDADAEADADSDEEIPDIPDIPEVDVDDDDETVADNTFLETDDEDTDLSDVIVARDDEGDEV